MILDFSCGGGWVGGWVVVWVVVENEINANSAFNWVWVEVEIELSKDLTWRKHDGQNVKDKKWHTQLYARMQYTDMDKQLIM